MELSGWIAAVLLVALLTLAVLATRRGWLRDEARPEDRVSSAVLDEISRNRAGNGIGP